MSGHWRYCVVLLLLSLILGLSQAQETALLSPGVFLRGLELANGVRYTATFIKPSDDTVLRNLSVEITLPADAQFTEMLVSRQVQFDVIRRNRQGQLTLIWQIARIDSETPLDAFSFTVAEVLRSEIEFYMIWQDEQGQRFLENFFELPTTISANESEATVSLSNTDFTAAGNTGIQVSSTSVNPLNFSVLANDFNPPAEYGAVWWCSLVELSGLDAGDSAMVLVPLRRPVAPFTELFLFQQQADGSWLALAEKGIVSADGQFVLYRHTGGLIATGGDEEIKQESVPAEEAVIEEAPPQENPQPQNNEPQPQPAPIENNVVVEVQPLPPVENPNPPQENPQPTAIHPTNAPAPTQSVQDGTSNTIIISEATFTPNPVLGDGTVQQLVPATVAPTQGIQDGTSNTIIFGEVTFTPTVVFGDGSVRQVVPATASPTQSIQDGTSNTIFVGEATFTPSPAPDSVAPIATFTATQAITDGTSNTIFVGEATFTPSPAPDSVAPTATFTATQGIQDGTSNTIFIGEATFTPSPAPDSVAPTATFTATQGIQDGTSNTIQLGEITATVLAENTVIASQTAENNPSATFTPNIVPTVVIIVTPPPFGTGGTRIVILQNSDGSIEQCQIGGILCAPLNRRLGNGLR